MTMYNCSICGKTHSSEDPPCPQTVEVKLSQGSPSASSDPVSPWRRRYFCVQCPRELQPREGFNLIGMHDHIYSHTIADLRECAQAAFDYEDCLLGIEDLMVDESVEKWDSRLLRFHIGLKVAIALKHKKPSPIKHPGLWVGYTEAER